jgi:hypothetical protein
MPPMLAYFPEHTSPNASLPRMHCSSMPPFQRIPAAFQPCSFGRKASTHTTLYRPCIWCCLQLLHPTDSPCLQLPLCNEQPAFFRLAHEHSNAAASPVAALHIQFMPSTTHVENALSRPEHVQHPVALSASHVTEHVQHPAAQSASHVPSTCNAMSHIMLLCTEHVQHPAALSASSELLQHPAVMSVSSTQPPIAGVSAFSMHPAAAVCHTASPAVLASPSLPFHQGNESSHLSEIGHPVQEPHVV